MNGGPFRRAQPGQPIELSAAAWNACLDAAEAHKAGGNGNNGGGIDQVRNADIVLVKNESGSDVVRFGVLGIAGVVFTAADSLLEFQSRVAFRGVTPTDADHNGKFVVCLDPIASGQMGRAWVSGVCVAKVEITSSSDMFCDVLGGNRSKLKASGSGSARILYKEGNSGEQWCVVRLGDRAGGGATIRLGQFSGPWYNEPGQSGADNVKLVKLYVQPSPAGGPNDWVPELDADGEEVIAVTLNLFSYIPTRSGNDSYMWCAVLPISDQDGEYWSGGYDYIDGQDVPRMKPYSQLWLLLAAEC